MSFALGLPVPSPQLFHRSRCFAKSSCASAGKGVGSEARTEHPVWCPVAGPRGPRSLAATCKKTSTPAAHDFQKRSGGES